MPCSRCRRRVTFSNSKEDDKTEKTNNTALKTTDTDSELTSTEVAAIVLASIALFVIFVYLIFRTYKNYNSRSHVVRRDYYGSKF